MARKKLPQCKYRVKTSGHYYCLFTLKLCTLDPTCPGRETGILDIPTAIEEADKKRRKRK